jgi:hypothetical protein
MYKILILIFLFVATFPLEEPKFLNISIKYNPENGFFTIPLSIGSNNEIFDVQIDTTSTNTWIPSPKFHYDVKKYDISKSSTGIISRRSFELEDIEGTVFGKACYDTIRLDDITLDNFGFGLINEVDYKFNDYPQGKLGLGYNELDKENENDFNLIKKLKNNSLIDKEEFIIDKFTNNLFIGNASSLFINLTRAVCPLIGKKQFSRKYRNSWGCLLTSFTSGFQYKISYYYDPKTNAGGPYFDGFEYIDEIKVNGLAIFDSSFKYISFPEAYLDIFNKTFLKELGNICEKFEDLNSFYFICYDVNASSISYRELDFIINGFTYRLRFENLFKKIKEGLYELLVRFYKTKENVFIFGNPFVYNFTISYDYEEKKITFYGGNSYTYDDLYNIAHNIYTFGNEKGGSFTSTWFDNVIFVIILLLALGGGGGTYAYNHSQPNQSNRPNLLNQENNYF